MTKNTKKDTIIEPVEHAEQPEPVEQIGQAEQAATTDKVEYHDFISAYKSVSPNEKRRAFTMLAAAGVTLALLFLSRLFWLFKPLFDLVYYGTLPIILYYILLGIVFTVFVILLNRYLKKHCGIRMFLPQDNHVSIPNTLAIIVIGALTMLFISIGLKFKVKVQVEMGFGVTMATALINLAIYVYYGLHLWLGLIAAALVQRALDILLPTRYSVPWGAILLVTVFGLMEFALEIGTTTHMYPWLYYILTYVYAAVYELTGRSFHLTFWACIIIMVL
ncbi:MAG: hypothetical protein J1F69_03400 [Clostridiales bacterium]|nr:hypothetical protein [Clostridiales bacterium]